ncbi:MAG: Zn-dependent protease [Bacteroidetes bacterium]|nr:MAG: Zn-dependent protease [Bacteroidota bacterium]
MRNAAILLLTLYISNCTGQVYKSDQPLAHTFSIVARDSITGDMAVGVQSHWFNVGAEVPWAQAGVGAIATQSFIDKSYGYKGLILLKQGYSAQQVLDSLVAADPGRDVRQVGIVDSRGNVAAHTGKGCIQYASHIKGANFTVQSNMMLSDQVCQSMARAFQQSAAKPLAERILNALDAAQGAGGDIRGKQSAVLIVVSGKASDKPWNDRKVDLRVDDNEKPLTELRRLYLLHVAYEHMNNGDLATEKNDMVKAMQEYGFAMKMFPDNLEMQYWAAITLANNRQVDQAIAILKRVFAEDKNWKELTRRLPSVGLLTVKPEDLKRILDL